MADFDYDDKSLITPVNPNLKAEPYRNINNDLKYTDRRDIIHYNGGMKWTVDNYYSQYLSPDMEVASQEINRPAIYQQYLRIVNLVLTVQSPLVSSVDPSTKEFNVNGVANMPPGLKPNLGDMFIAKSLDGRMALYVVTATRPLEYFLDSLYQIEYSRKDYVTNDLLADLTQKSVKTKYFIEKFYAFGRDPFLEEIELKHYNTLIANLDRLTSNYFQEFFSDEYSVFLIPDQPLTTYDPYLNKFISRIIDKERYSEYARVIDLNCDKADYITTKTIWDVMQSREFYLIDHIPFKFNVIPSTEFSGLARYGTVRYSGIRNVYFPIIDDTEPTERLEPSPPRTLRRPIPLNALFDNKLTGLTYGVEQIDITKIPPIHNITDDDYYLFSENFYMYNLQGMSYIELLVYKAINGQRVDIDLVNRLIEYSMYWNKLQKFYQLPVLIYLASVALGDIN